jgi:hypothetical protein
MPNLSPGYALISPIPGPAALALALVDEAIRSTGRVEHGRKVFELLKSSPIEAEPPEAVSVMKFFVKRLKPDKQANLIESTGIREYCHSLGPWRLYFQVENGAEEIARLLWRLRRLGTTDSLLTCEDVKEEEPRRELTWKSLDELPVEEANFAKRFVVTLTRLSERASFDEVNPFSSARGKPFEQVTLALPLVVERQGETWVLYRKEPFSLEP